MKIEAKEAREVKIILAEDERLDLSDELLKLTEKIEGFHAKYPRTYEIIHETVREDACG